MAIFSVYGYATEPALPVPAITASEQEVRDSIIKIYTSFNRYSPVNPWTYLGSEQKTGSGVIIALENGQKAILTNSHVVVNHTYIEGRKNSQITRHRLKLLWVSHELDLALLEPFHSKEQGAFFGNVLPVPLGELPPLQTDLILLGYPIGGDTISATKGVLSRLEYHHYAHSELSFLVGQIDAASNPGNSGGPAIVDGKIVGLLMQRYKPNEASNIAHIVPITMIRHFLTDISDGKHHGIPSLGAISQRLENDQLKARYGVNKNEGVLVRHIIPESAADPVLQPDDIILELGGQPVSNDKTIVLRNSERVSMQYTVHSRQIGEELPIRIIRDKQELELSIQLTKPINSGLLIQTDYGSAPSYFIYHGFVFSRLTRELWQEKKYDPTPYFSDIIHNFRIRDRKEVVVVLKVLPHEANRGYMDITLSKVDSIGTTKINSLKQLVHLIESENQDFLELNLGHEGLSKVVLNTHLGNMINEEVMGLNGIQYDRSEGLRQTRCQTAKTSADQCEAINNP